MAANGDKQGASQGPNRPTGNVPRVVYTPSPDATPQGELAALASAYAFILNRHNSKKTAPQARDGEHAGESFRQLPAGEGA